MATQWQPALEEGKDAMDAADLEPPNLDEDKNEKESKEKTETSSSKEKVVDLLSRSIQSVSKVQLKDERQKKRLEKLNDFDEEKLRAAFVKVKKDQARIVQTTIEHFTAFIKKSGQLSIQRFPLHHYLIQQCLLHCYDILLKLKRSKLLIYDIRENLENLCYLADILKTDYKDMSFILMNKVSLIVTMVSDFAPLLEKESELPETNWKQLSVWLKRKSNVQGKKIEDMVPQMNQFKMGRLLGAGGFGAVFKANLGDVVSTLKFVPCHRLPNPKFACVDKVVATMINNPFLVKYYACFATEQAYVTCMEFIKGVDLQKVLRAARTFPKEINTLVIAQLGSAVAHMHYKGFTHRDIKPANMLVMPGMRVKLIDFDTVKIFCGKFAGKRLATYFRRTAIEVLDGQRAGTPPYFAPEVVAKKAYGRAIDWWAVGVTAFVQATGKLPFYSKDRDDMFKKIRNANLVFPENKFVDEEMIEYIEDTLRKNPFERLGSRDYSDFFNHTLFSNLNWEELATKPILNDYKYILDCMKGGGGTVSPVASPAALDKKNRLFPKEQFDDTKDQKPLFTYASPGFIRSLAEVRAGRVPNQNTVYDKPVDFAEDKDTTYKFHHFLPGGVPPVVPPEDLPVKGEASEEEEFLKDLDKPQTKKRKPGKAKDYSDGIPSITVVVKRGANGDVDFGVCGVEYRGADNYLVNELKPDSPAAAQGLVFGDFLIKCNGKPLRGLEHADVVSILKESEEATLAVHPFNPFRLLPINADACKILRGSKLTQRTYGLKEGVTVSSSCEDFGFEMKCVAGKLPNSFFYIVTKAEKVFAIEKNTRIMIGDIIRAVNNVELPKDSDVLPESIFKGHTGDTKISILPTCPTRHVEMKSLSTILTKLQSKSQGQAKRGKSQVPSVKQGT